MSTEMASVRIVVLPARLWTPTGMESVIITAQMAAVEADEGVAAVDVGDKRI